MRRYRPSKRTNRPHISSDNSYVKEQKTKQTTALIFLAQPSPHLQVIYARPSRPTAAPLSFVSDSLRFGKAVFRPGVQNPQEQKVRKTTFSFCMLKVALDTVVCETFATIFARHAAKVTLTSAQVADSVRPGFDSGESNASQAIK